MGFILKKLYIPVLITTLLVACGDDSSNNAVFPNSEISSDSNEKPVSSSSSAKTTLSSVSSPKGTSSSSAKETLLSSSSSLMEIDTLEGLDIIYVLVDGTVSGVVALDDFAKAKVRIVQLDTADAYKETSIAFSGDVGKGGAYEIKKIELPQPYVQISVDGKIENVTDGKSASVSLKALGDATSSEKFNLNLLTTLEAERTLELLGGKKASFEEAKFEAAEDVWKMFNLESIDFDVTENIHVSDASESGAALLASTVLLQAGASSVNGDFAKFFKAVSADVANDGKWDDDGTRLAIADWALATDIKDGFAALRKSIEKKIGKVSGFEKYLKNFYLG